jgi:hypothetical protein
LKDTNQFISDLQDSILELNKEKAEKDEEWAQTQDDHAYAVRVITAAKNIIQGGLTSFIETKIPMKGVFAQVSQHFTTEMKKSHMKKKSFGSIFKVLSQITASEVHANTEAVQRIIDLCDELLDKLADSLDAERRSYQHYVDYYTQTLNGWTDILDEKHQVKADLEAEINVLNKQISQA